VCWHVTSSVNRKSIVLHGLDWRRMGATGGIARGDRPGARPEAEGVFLCGSDGDVEFFLTMDGHPLLDVWEVDAWDLELDDWPDGWMICRSPILPDRIRLVRRDVPPRPRG
jgi:hypothetical protein